jgi:ribonuclease G
MNSLIIVQQETFTYVCLFDELNKLIECHPYSESQSSIVGNIYIGVVKNKIKGIGGYFVEFGQDKNGFLPISKNNNQLSPGQSVIIQVDKDAYSTKGAKLTSSISFSGEYVVLVTDSTDIHFSSKLPEDARTKGLKSMIHKFKSDEYGFIVRTNAYDGVNSQITDEIEDLISKYNKLQDIKDYRPNYSCLLNANVGWLKYVQNMNKSNLSQIVVNSDANEEKISSYLKEASLHNNITVNKDVDIYNKLDIGNMLSKALRRKTWLPSGASIVIDRTEAMFVIDVNSDKNISKRNNQRNLIKINIEAAKEIAKQIRLRNLSGIILIDFIDLNFEEDRIKLIEALNNSLKDDPIRVINHGLTSLGIVELTRKRLEPCLEDKLKGIPFDL